MRVKLENVCDKGTSNVKQSDVVNMTGGYPIYGAAGYIGNVNFYHQDKPYVAVVKDGAGIGRTTLHPAKSSVIGTMQYLLPKDNVLPEYLYYVVRHMHLEKYFTGATIPHIYFRDYKSEEFNLDSLDKQAEIIEILGRVELVIQKRKQQLAELDNLVKARFVELFDACNCRISTFGKEFSFISRGKSPSYVELSDLAVINQACIYCNGLNFDKAKYNDVSYSGDRILQFGDVLVNSTGTGTLGRANIFMRRSADKRYMADSHVTIIRGSVSCHPVYIKCYLEQAKIQDAIYRNCVSGSTNQIELSKEKFKELELPVPPMTLQQQFAAFVEQTDKSKLAVQQSLEKLETLKKSLMQQYFG